jgi:hypothetical protein
MGQCREVSKVVETRLCARKRVLEFAKRQALTTRQSLREVDESRYRVVRIMLSPYIRARLWKGDRD